MVLLRTNIIGTVLLITPGSQRWWNKNMIGGAGVRGCKAADYLCEASAYKGEAKAPLAPPPPPGSAALAGSL